MSDGMSAERLAEIRAYNDEYGIGGTTDADSIVTELLNEVKRLRGLLTAETTLAKGLLQRTVELGTRADNAEAACEDLRARLDEIGETREAIATAIENLPEPEPDANYAVPAWFAGYEQAMEDAARIARGEVEQEADGG